MGFFLHFAAHAQTNNDTVYVYPFLFQTENAAEIQIFLDGPQAYQDSITSIQFPVTFFGGVPSGVEYHNGLATKLMNTNIKDNQVLFSWLTPTLEMFKTSPLAPILTIKFDKPGVDSIHFGDSDWMRVEFSTITARDTVPPIVTIEALPWKLGYVQEGAGLEDYAPAIVNTISAGDSKMIKVYPNPTTGTVRFEAITPPNRMRIYDLAGKVMYDGEFKHEVYFSQTGIFFVQLDDIIIKVIRQ